MYGLDHEKDQIICQVFVTVDHAGSRISFKRVLIPPLGSSFQMLYYSVIVIFLKFNSRIMNTAKMKIIGFEIQEFLRKGY